jgi:hypothetical protein
MSYVQFGRNFFAHVCAQPRPRVEDRVVLSGSGTSPRAGLGPSFLIRQADIEPGVFGMGAGRDDWA